MKTGIKFKPCNVGTADAHNRRLRAYCEAVAHKFGQTYFWDAYRHLNVSWRSPAYPKPLPDVLEDLKCNLQIFLCLFLEKLNMPLNTPVTKALQVRFSFLL